MESSTFLLRDENEKVVAAFTGDTLFIGDVGRPDLAVKSDLSREDLAGLLFDSLRNKIMPLADEVIVYPGHGAGSACGKKMAKETESTIGIQKEMNYALRADMTRDEFILEVTTGLVDPPQYFPKNAVMNKMGYDSFDTVLQRGVVARSTVEFSQLVEQEDALILDVRPAAEFVKGFVPGSIFIGLDGQFASWVGTLITDLKQPILLVTPEGQEEEAVTRLSRVGYDNCLGYLNGGVEAWKKAGNEMDTIESVPTETFINLHTSTPVLDVRRNSEFETEHVLGATNIPLDVLNKYMDDIDREKTYLVHCASGYRSVIAISILKARGIEHLINIEGGFKGIKDSGAVELTAFQEQITEL
jgi:rhodanese-related sulfurtransferase